MSYQPYPRLQLRPTTDPRMRYYNRPKYLVAPDASLLPPVVDSIFAKGMNDARFHSRPPFQRLNNLVGPVTTAISAKVVGAWRQANYSRGRMACGPFIAEGDRSFPISNNSVDIPVSSRSSQSIVKQSVQATLVESHKVASENCPPQTCIACPQKRPRTTYPSSDRGDISQKPGTCLGSDPIRKRFRTSSKATSQVEPGRAVIQEGIRFERTELRPFAEWLSDHLYALLVQDKAHFSSVYPVEQIVISKLLDILVHYRPQPTVVFLALWYLTRLFPEELVNYHVCREDSREVIARAFLLGLTLAFKWLDDFTRKNTTWMHFCSLGIKSINKVERSALSSLDYNLDVSKGEWEAWLLHLLGSTVFFKTAVIGQLTAFGALNEVISAAEKGHAKCVRQTPSHTFLDNLNLEMLQDLSLAPAGDLTGTPSVIPDPAPWNPAADCIIKPCRRAMCDTLPSVGIIGRHYGPSVVA